MIRLRSIRIPIAAVLLFVFAADAAGQGGLLDRIRNQRAEAAPGAPSARAPRSPGAEEDGEAGQPSASARPASRSGPPAAQPGAGMPEASARPLFGRARSAPETPAARASRSPGAQEDGEAGLPSASARPASRSGLPAAQGGSGIPEASPRPLLGRAVNAPVAEPGDDARPSSRPPSSDRASPEEDAIDEPAPDRTPLGVDVAALRVIPHQRETDPGASPGAERIEIHPEVAAPARLESALEPFLGEPVSMALLAEISAAIIEAWRESDFPIVDVYYPEQNITGGRLQVVAREAVLGAVETEGTTRHTDPEYLKRNIRLDPGDRIDRRILEADLDWLNLNPVRQVNLIYERGDLDGTSDILLETIEEDPFTIYVGFANTGFALTGENEWSAGFNWSNPFRTEQSFAYHFSGDADFENIEAHTFFYRGFLPWRHELRLIGAVFETDVQTDLGNDLVFGTGGEAIQATAEYRVPLPRPASARRLQHTLVGAFDYKSTNTDLLFGGINVFASRLEVFQFRAEHESMWRDELGATRLTLGSVWSPGGALPNNDDASFDEQREGAAASYWYGFARLERGFELPGDFQLVLRGTGHLSGDRLTSTEQLLAGGYLSVRGFEENLVRGDSGGVVNTEIVSPPFSLAAFLPGEHALQDRWSLLAFYDGAFLDISDPLPGELSPSLQSVGIGLSGQIGQSAVLRAAYGWVVDTYGIPEEELDAGRFHFGVTVRN